MSSHVRALASLSDNREGVLVIGPVSYPRQGTKVNSLFLDIFTLTWSHLANFDFGGIHFYDGNMFLVGDTLYIVPLEEGLDGRNLARRNATQIFSRNMTDKNGLWIAHNTSENFELGRTSRGLLEIKEYSIEWV